MSLLDEFNVIIAKEEKALASTAIELHAQLVKDTPVQTGNLIAQWVAPTKISGGWQIVNTENVYGADVIFKGLHVINGRTYGSRRLKNGITPILMQHEILLQNELRKIK